MGLCADNARSQHQSGSGEVEFVAVWKRHCLHLMLTFSLLGHQWWLIKWGWSIGRVSVLTSPGVLWRLLESEHGVFSLQVPLLSSSCVDWSYPLRPSSAQWAGDTFVCCSSVCVVLGWHWSLFLSKKKKKFYAHCFLGCLPKFSHCWLQFRSDLLLALVAALKAAWGLQSVFD